MALVRPEAGRARVEEFADRVEVTIPVRRGFSGVCWIAMLCFYLAVCIAVGISATVGPGSVYEPHQGAGQAVGPQQPVPAGFVLFWLAVWGAAAAYVLRLLAYALVGRERIVAGADLLSVQHLPLGIRRDYATETVQNLRAQSVSPQGADIWAHLPTGRAGSIAFDHGARTVRCGSGIDEAEARGIVELVQRRMGKHLRAE